MLRKRATLLFFGSRSMPLNTSANHNDCVEQTSRLSLTETSIANGCRAHYRRLSAPSGLWQTRRELNCTNSRNAPRTFVRIYLLVFLSLICVVLIQIFRITIIITHQVCKGRCVKLFTLALLMCLLALPSVHLTLCACPSSTGFNLCNSKYHYSGQSNKKSAQRNETDSKHNSMTHCIFCLKLDPHTNVLSCNYEIWILKSPCWDRKCLFKLPWK